MGPKFLASFTRRLTARRQERRRWRRPAMCGPASLVRWWWCSRVKTKVCMTQGRRTSPSGPQPLSGRWERARGRSEGIFGHFCLSQFGLSAAHQQVQPSLVLAAQLELYKRARGSGAGLKAGSDDIFAVHFSLVSSYGGLWQGGARQGKVAYGKMARRRSNLPGLLN